MADFNEFGLDELLLSLEEVADLPDEILTRMLEAEGEVIADAQAKKIRELVPPDSTGQLTESVTINKKLRRKNGARYITVYPQGVRSKRGNAAQNITNAEVGFINEYGAPGRGIDAKQWMRLANAESEDAAGDAAAKVYHGWLDSKDL